MAPPFPHTYITEWPNLECVHAQVTFSPLCISGSCQTTCVWLLIVALPAGSKPGRLRSTVITQRTPLNLHRFKPPQKTRSVGLQYLVHHYCLQCLAFLVIFCLTLAATILQLGGLFVCMFGFLRNIITNSKPTNAQQP